MSPPASPRGLPTLRISTGAENRTPSLTLGGSPCKHNRPTSAVRFRAQTAVQPAAPLKQRTFPFATCAGRIRFL
jgi:hypothetical protein